MVDKVFPLDDVNIQEHDYGVVYLDNPELQGDRAVLFKYE